MGVPCGSLVSQGHSKPNRFSELDGHENTSWSIVIGGLRMAVIASRIEMHTETEVSLYGVFCSECTESREGAASKK